MRSRRDVQALPDVYDRREVRLEALVIRVLFLCPIVGALACNGAPKPHDPGVKIDAPAPFAEGESRRGQSHPVEAGEASSGALPAASSGACATDDDCRTFSSYCAEAPCACRVVSASDPPPRCLGAAPSNVRCFADPCMNKAARCQSGACVLTAK